MLVGKMQWSETRSNGQYNSAPGIACMTEHTMCFWKSLEATLRDTIYVSGEKAMG